MLSPADTFCPRDLADFEALALARLPHRCSIRRAVSTPDGSGGSVDVATEVLTVPCALTRMLTPREIVSGEAVAGLADWRLLVPKESDIGERDEVLPWWLWDVTLGGATAGTFTLSYGGLTTPPISYGATQIAVLSRLGALASIGQANVGLWGYTGGPWAITFTRARQNTQIPLTADFSGLTGASATIERPAFTVLGVEDMATDAPQMTVYLTRRR